jgi:CheY-like chemotaxis protein
VESDVGLGSRFHVYLPAVTQSEPRPVEPRTVAPPRGRGELILVVDDEAAIRTIVQEMLVTHGYRTRLAKDGAEAVAIYAQHSASIRLVLTDSAMPVMDGPALIRALAKINPAAKVILMTGLVERDRMLELIGPSSVELLDKPFTAEVLLQRLHEATRLRA